MGNTHSGAGPVLAITGAVWVIEIIIVLAIIALLITVFVLYRRQNAPAKPDATTEGTQGYYADVSQLGGQPTAAAGAQPNFGAQPGGDPFAGFGGAATAPANAMAAPAAAAAAPAAPAPPPAAAPPASPPPGTPAGWLPDPSGATDTLRYWDGNGWTQHVAQRS